MGTWVFFSHVGVHQAFSLLFFWNRVITLGILHAWERYKKSCGIHGARSRRQLWFLELEAIFVHLYWLLGLYRI